MKILAVIPARIGSTRLLEKPLKKINGKEMILWVYEGVKESNKIDEIIVATDSSKIKDVAEKNGYNAVLTSRDHKTGTDRICEVVNLSKVDYDIVINVQGDEPLIKGKDLDKLIKPMIENESIKVATPIQEMSNDFDNPNSVKVVKDKNDFALYFSRSEIPFERGKRDKVYKHIGIYAFRKSFLLNFNKWEQTNLEKSEKLEQLRILENGYKIKVVVWDSYLHGVDTEKDLKIVEKYLKGE
ncbi:MAG TPA: 3-deoxy-manno-octulosonate cytidylyltransferase [Candidatus Mcinerneyibacterium sp.]|nr:3-deoxy-manno-octulosonate cytidylyltransferase [Candidatus Mcinerneyibacterium sp.]